MRPYRLETWRIAARGRRGIALRPTGRSALDRLGFTILCAMFVGILVFSERYVPEPRNGQPTAAERAKLEGWDARTQKMAQDFIDRGVLTQERVDELAAGRERKYAEDRAKLERTDSIFRGALYSGIGFFVILGLLSPASVLWESVTVQNSARGELLIRRRDSIGWRRTRRYPVQHFSMLLIMARESQTGGRHGPRSVRWIWDIVLQGPDALDGAIFSVDAQPDRPSEKGPLPKKVERVAQTLAQLTGAKCEPGYTVAEIRGGGLDVSGLTQSLMSRTEKVEDWDALPPDVLADIQRLRERGRSGGIRITRSHSVKTDRLAGKITFRAHDGTEHTYDSIEDAPPEVKEVYKRFK